jgi:exopolyphosphatase / guanosine-5'-triphosphate,3'-diphosphate pyrophosphatase
LVKTMQSFKYLMQVYEIGAYRAVATSAMREAENARQTIASVKNETGLRIELITGEEEADLIFGNFKVQQLDPSGNYLYIDVGGGSTELTLIKHGERIRSISFRIGTVRALQGKVSKKRWVEARNWIREMVKDEEQLIAIGTGGNINRIFRECGKKSKELITRQEIQTYYDDVRSYTYVQRVTQLGLKPDRADVILPAAEIFANMMDFAHINHMMVPKVGLSDGIILNLFENWKAANTKQKVKA